MTTTGTRSTLAQLEAEARRTQRVALTLKHDMEACYMKVEARLPGARAELEQSSQRHTEAEHRAEQARQALKEARSK